uniref:Nucleoporin Nup43 n=1 Tax=Anopheles epiroticus TaxID=199890 RepID=A0A182P7J8_9DIPT
MYRAKSEDGQSTEILSFLLSNKMSHVRWLPHQTEDEHFFVTGSWGERVNTVRLWNLVYDELGGDDETGVPLSPKLTAEFGVTGDIVGLEFIDDKLLASVTSEGTLSVLDLNRESTLSCDFTHKYNMHDLHMFNGNRSVCTSVSAFNQYITTGGEDGCVNIVAADAGQVVRTIRDTENSSSIQCITFIYPDLVMTGRQYGLIDCYDTRDDQSKPVFSVETCYEGDRGLNKPTCMNYFPRNKQIVVIGLESGPIIMWDIRKPYGASLLCGGHEHSVTDIQFAKEEQNFMLSTDMGGRLTQWTLNGSAARVEDFIESRRPRLSEFKPINTVDMNLRYMLCGGDSEMLYMLELEE